MPLMTFRNFCVLLLPLMAFFSCAEREVLEVWPLHLRSGAPGEGDDAMLRGELRGRMHGAVTVAEQAERLGHYYTVRWEDGSAAEGELLFEFQQGATGSRVKTMRHRIGAGEGSGKKEFLILGEEYRKGGRVLAWRCRLFREGREIASRQSYLWQ
ncbi:MAG: hypothetical protein EAZ65_06220 [Verrucomicrobia bacterium]|nr:MAG: hypothetical protein EAZ84_10730 [Verrucomicrobiota bacterium]TAE87682.1 MAG: hypothetical protein EAZ82_06915 [Verrucomicrobiota bacterium]TAF25383.1 MAG: hypothetical protein EAZ71_07830 [Verrucomicrobiota bacterium]TAF41170.1 MAG: hypothetical protein EAZ65_06220 [Verrucomicrobiota bacterium]